MALTPADKKEIRDYVDQVLREKFSFLVGGTPADCPLGGTHNYKLDLNSTAHQVRCTKCGNVIRTAS